MNERRIGQFELSIELAEKWRECLPIFAQFFIVKAEYLVERRLFNYIAYSDLFDEVREGCRAPLYTLHIETDKNGLIAVRAFK